MLIYLSVTVNSSYKNKHDIKSYTDCLKKNLKKSDQKTYTKENILKFLNFKTKYLNNILLKAEGNISTPIFLSGESPWTEEPGGP